LRTDTQMSEDEPGRLHLRQVVEVIQSATTDNTHDDCSILSTIGLCIYNGKRTIANVRTHDDCKMRGMKEKENGGAVKDSRREKVGADPGGSGAEPKRDSKIRLRHIVKSNT
jgi:hypothetical protein